MMVNTGEGRAYIGSRLSVLIVIDPLFAADPLFVMFAKVAKPRKIQMIFNIM